MYELRILKPEIEIMRLTSWLRIRWQNSVSKELQEMVGSGKPTVSVLEETIAVSVTISISVQNRHSRILLRALLRSRVWKMRREPKVPEEPKVWEAEVPVEECFDCPAEITSKELAITHFLKSGTLQNACSTRRRVVADLVKSARKHIVRLMNNRLKGPKRMITRVQ